MEFRRLELFVAVAEELHFTRAATRVGMAQPPLSQQIRRLEEELGVPLLVRTSRKVELTAAGAQVLEGARELLSRRAELISAVRRAADGESGVLRLGFNASSAFGLLPEIIRRFRHDFPNVRLQIDDRDTPDLGSALATGELDLAIARGPFRHPKAVCEDLLCEPFLLALPASHPLACHDVVAVSDLADQPFVLFPRAAAPGLHDTITSMCLSAGFSPTIAQEAGSWSSVVSLVEAGLGITLAPASARAVHPPGVTFRRLNGAAGEAELVLVAGTRPLPPSALRFRDIARQVAAEVAEAPWLS